MYVCHCNRIPEREIRAAIDNLTQDGEIQGITPADVLMSLNRAGKCLGCFPLIESMLTNSETADHSVSVQVEAHLPTQASGPPKKRRGGAFARRANA